MAAVRADSFVTFHVGTRQHTRIIYGQNMPCWIDFGKEDASDVGAPLKAASSQQLNTPRIPVVEQDVLPSLYTVSYTPLFA